MDIKAYIESGKLENYVLGMGSPEERQEAECMARIFPEVRQELESIQASLEQYAMTNKVEPPASVKSKVFAEIDKDRRSAKSEAKVVKMDAARNAGTGMGLKLLLAASVLLVLLCGYAIRNLQKKNSSLAGEISLLKDAQQQLNSRFTRANEQLAVISNPNATHVVMKGTPVSPQSVAIIYWNKESKDVFIAVNSLPQPPQGKQYQLWGIVGGKPVDLGVFDVLSPADSMLQKMKSVEGATTFAVTLEKAGGSPVPSLDQMFVAGNL